MESYYTQEGKTLRVGYKSLQDAKEFLRGVEAIGIFDNSTGMFYVHGKDSYEAREQAKSTAKDLKLNVREIKFYGDN